MTIHGYEIVSDWKNSYCGKVAVAVKGGKRYCLKKYMTYVAPFDDGVLDTKTFLHNKKAFEDFVATRKANNARLRSISGFDNVIPVPCEEFVDGHYYMEVSKLIENIVSMAELRFVLDAMPFESKRLLMKIITSGLVGLHSIGIVHGDLSIENVVVYQGTMGNYAAKLTGFSSYFSVGTIPDDFFAVSEYQSPELAKYSLTEEENKEMGEGITEKSDIFSLGLLFHFFLVGDLPEPVSLTEKLQRRKDQGKRIYPWLALNHGGQLQISDQIQNDKIRLLIADMLKVDPNDRPSAKAVFKRL